MNIYDKQIEDTLSLLPKEPAFSKPFDKNMCWPVCSKDTIIFRNETAFELGGFGNNSVCTVMYTDISNVEDEILLYGKDLYFIKEDCDFAHIVIVGLKSGNDDIMYEQLKDIEFSIYRLYLKGYNIRISPVGEREQVRVSKEAVANKISFWNIGCSLIEEFHKNPMVQSVKVIFVTQKGVDFKALSNNAKKASAITKTVTAKFQSLALDCANCEMKPICDEVEGLRELHFKNNKEAVK